MFNYAVVQSKTVIMDNKASKDNKNGLKYSITYHLVPLHTHHIHLSEQAMYTFKQQSKTDLAIMDPDFPLFRWDLSIDKAEMGLNMLCLSPKSPAYVYLF